MQALVSIHDVMPDNMARVEEILHQLPAQFWLHTSLLVVPGLAWQDKQIEKLRAWQQAGLILAGHGWSHKTQVIKGIYPLLHSKLISRDAAEHLSLSATSLVQLLQRNYQWFGQHNLLPPDLYVPPAWAMGKLCRKLLQESPFRYFETSWGIYDTQTKRHCLLPLVGFEADTPVRKRILSAWNKLNHSLASNTRPLRIAIHPHDNYLLLAAALNQEIQRIEKAISHRQLFGR